MSFSISLRNA